MCLSKSKCYRGSHIARLPGTLHEVAVEKQVPGVVRETVHHLT